MEIIYRKLSEMKKLEGNPRKITQEQMETLKQSLEANRDYFEARPLILSDRTGELVVIAENQRYEACRQLGIEECPTVLLSGLTEEREKEIIIRDNVSNTLADVQAEAIKEAIEEMKHTTEYEYCETFGNENSNGNALYLIVRQWVDARK